MSTVTTISCSSYASAGECDASLCNSIGLNTADMQTALGWCASKQVGSNVTHTS